MNVLICFHDSVFEQSERMAFAKFTTESFVIGKDLLADNNFTNSENIWIKLVEILCVFSMTSISIIMTNDELSFIKSKKWPRDMKNALLHLLSVMFATIRSKIFHGGVGHVDLLIVNYEK